MPHSNATSALVAAAQSLQKYAIAQLISLCEAETPAARDSRVAALNALGPGRRGLVVGLTGSPGAGKSSLIGALALELFARDQNLAIAVLAIDPSSPTSGGALLGDRVRTNFPVGAERLYFRSQASAGDLGGVGRRTCAATRALTPLFDLVLVETVGIGQSEIEIRHLADRVLLVLQPLTGDHVQFLKAGVMEIPDAYVINKCDEAALAKRALGELRSALRSAQILAPGGGEPWILQTSAHTAAGIPQLADYLLAERSAALTQPDATHARARFYLRKEVARRFGEYGLAQLALLEPQLPPPTSPDWFERAEALVFAALPPLPQPS